MKETTRAFLEREENVLLLGPPDVDKTHRDITLGMDASWQLGQSIHHRQTPDQSFQSSGVLRR